MVVSHALSQDMVLLNTCTHQDYMPEHGAVKGSTTTVPVLDAKANFGNSL
jgi:hypothetical protein